MKTIQMAFATSLHFLKLPIILLALFFNFSIGEPLPISSNTSTVPIGGQYVPRNYAVNTLDIGGHGGTATRKLMDIGGNGAGFAPRNILQEVSNTTASIDLPIGGSQVPPRRLNELGGQSVPETILKDQSICDISQSISTFGNQFNLKITPEISEQAVPRYFEIGGGGGQERRTLAIGGNQTGHRAKLLVSI